ncbi:MAG TPA: hypothetical protein VLG25_02790, partial [Patescibacteria group bacterium]|nr:hypothetical protein [Patescibacteria group bacterium]
SRYYASIGDKSFSLDNLPAVAKDQKLEVYGTSVANAKVTVTSENNTLASVTAQSNGDWEATLDLSKLAIGSHDAKIDLSANGQTNSKTFKLVLADETTAVQSQQAMRTITPPQHSKPVSKIPLIVVSSVVGLVLAAGVTGLYLLRDKKPKLPITTPLAPVAPAAPPPPQQPQLQPHTLITPDAPTPPETPPQTS